MAAVYIGLNEQLKDMTRCCICTEVYADPRMLSCIHTFCLRCLEQTGEQSDKKPGDKLPCPVCRKEFIIPDGGMNGIQKNFFMDNLIEMTKIGNPPEEAPCSFCLENIDEFDENDEEVPRATGCCIDCHENLCDDCSMHHRKQKPTRSHQIVPLGSEVVPRQVATLKSCNQHSSEHLKIYCFNCKTVVCVLCFVESHKPHECTDIHKVADDFRQKIGQDAHRMSQLLTEGATRITCLEKARTDVNRKVDVMENQIRFRADELRALIDAHLQRQLVDLSTRKLGMLKKLEVDENETKQHLSIVESFQNYCSEVGSKGSPGDVCASANDLQTRADELQQLHQSLFRVPVTQFNCDFRKMNLEGILDLSNNNILGHINDNSAAVSLQTPGVKAMDPGNKIHLGNEYRTEPQQKFGHIQPIQNQMAQFQQVNYVHVPAFHVINKESIDFPKYWRHKNLNPRGDGSSYQRFQIDRGDQLYRELENMFTRVLGNNPNPNHARDFQWDQYNMRSRKISKIWCIENAYLYGKYAEKKEAFCANALVNTYRPLTSLLGSELVTFKPEMKLVNSTLNRHINEYFLFHGATHETQERISKVGFIASVAGNNDLTSSLRRSASRNLQERKFGCTGIYFKETIEIQEDMDNIDQRRNHNQSVRYAFVARVLLGNSYLCKEPKVFKRTPCMERKCYSDSCNHHLLSGSYDSVLGITNVGHQYPDSYHGRCENFEKMSRGTDVRDFLIYSPEQSYPDFLIEYQ